VKRLALVAVLAAVGAQAEPAKFVPPPPPPVMVHPLPLQKRVLPVAPAVVVAPVAPAPGPKKPPPMPTDAECLALGAPMTPTPFMPGETLDFDVDALGAHAATMTMRTLPLNDGLLPLEVNVETNTLFNKIRKVTGVGKSWLSPKTLRPARYFEDAHEDTIHRIADVTFKKNNLAHLISDIDGRKWEGDLRWGNDISDVASTVYLLRALPMKEGQKMCIDVYGIRAIWRVWGKVLPREHVSTPLGEFETWHLAGEAARLDWPEMRREVHVWVSDDAKRLPLAALGMIDLGAVRASLKGFSRPGETSTRAQNKADIKW